MEKDTIKEFRRINNLLAFYKELLTGLQQEIMEAYYAYDLSLREISEDKKISRTAVQDCLKKSISKLEILESKLHLVEKDKRIQEILDEAKKTSSMEILELVEKLERVDR